MGNEKLNNEVEIKIIETTGDKQTEEIKPEEVFTEQEISEIDEIIVDNNAVTSEMAAIPKPQVAKGPANIGYSVRMVVVLTAICAFVALLLAVVNHLTVDVIAENTIKARDAAILKVFPEGDLVEMHGGDGVVETELNGETVSGKVYRIYKSGAFIGHCVNVAPDGYENPINMMVGIDTTNTVVGITMIEIKETAGVGSKTNSEGFLGQFINKAGPFTIGETVDGIAGATISSKAVTKGVNMALALVQKLTSSNTPIVPAPEETVPTETESAETEPAETEPAETVPAETETTETEAEETQSVEETVYEEIEPEETEPVVTRPFETEPVETQPVVTWPEETEPVETMPVVTWPVETEPEETEPEETETEGTETEETETEDGESEETNTDVSAEETLDFETEDGDNWVTDPTETAWETETEEDEEETTRPHYIKQ